MILPLQRMTGWSGLTAYFFMLFVVGTQSTDTLGKGFFLPEQEIGAPLHGGRSIFQTIPDSCFQNTDDRSSRNDRTEYSSTASFYNSISTEFDLSAQLQGMYTMGFTLNSKTKSMSRGKVQVNGTSIDIWNHVSTAIIDKDCITGSSSVLSDDLMKSLNALPEISKPELATSWTMYRDFLTNYGSHVVTQIYYGSSLKHWTFAKTENRYTREEMNIRSCADFEGPTKVGKLNVSACVNVNTDKIRRVMNLEVSSKLELHGGSDESRNQLLKDRSDELITKFMNEGRRNKSPIKYKYTPIWDILKSKSMYNITSGHYGAALTLEQYYIGYLDFGCSLIKDRSVQLRRFQFSPHTKKHEPDYECVLEREGCHSDGDCHLGAVGKTYCYGQSCVEHAPATSGLKAESAKMRKGKTGQSKQGINKSCKYEIRVKATCNLDYSQDKIIWDGPISGTARIKWDKLCYLFHINVIFIIYLFTVLK